MKIGLYHGYNLTGSGSNEYTRYLARTLLDQGHTVHIICREYHPEKIDYIGQLWRWDRDGNCEVTAADGPYADTCVLHQIPTGDVYPVYITDKQRSGRVKEFVDLSDEELAFFKALNHKILTNIFSRIELDVLHANHLVMQPSLAVEPCRLHNIPLIIYPHGSAIEYTVKKDPRYQAEARKAILDCRGLIIGNTEVRERICGLFPDLAQLIRGKSRIVGVGVDTQLFKPTTRSGRQASIASLLQLKSMQSSQGKTPQLCQWLYQQLDDGNYRAATEAGDHYLHNSVDTDIREKLAAVDFTRPVMLFVGALTAGKGLQSLLCALPQIYKSCPQAQLLIIGAGRFREILEAFVYALARGNRELVTYLTERRFIDENQDEAGLWQDVVYYLHHQSDADDYYDRAKRMLDQVTFLGRFDHQQLSYVFPCADIAVFPSVIPEAYPLVLMESLANGVLPVVSYFSGFKDGVDDLRTFLDEQWVSHMKIPMDVESRVESIAANIVTLLERLKTADLADELSGIARENYDWTHRARQMVTAYRELVSGQ